MELVGKSTWHPQSGQFKLQIWVRLILTLEMFVEGRTTVGTALAFVPTHLPSFETLPWSHFFQECGQCDIPEPVQCHIYAMAFPFDLRCESVT